ncbi:gamma-glutamylcyclotransferase family protein [Rheinheimera sp.]|uniref:gamma-glutamylcyclotransferase family protein n=1 Tax=Rheinheimera sp. TaxID=1869214 RepID=UPI0027B93750|nr:gamma-glutamylcyclotransferase family protein [Rheinheimera sp.]
MATTTHIFVYGLLTFPDIVTAITGQQIQMKPAVLTGFRRYGLSQSPTETPVPVLLPEPGYRQAGQLLLNVEQQAVEKLDFFEDLDSGHYVKTAVRVEVEGRWLDAFCYCAGPALAPYASGDWSAERVTEQDKQYFIQTLIPEMLAALANRSQ